MESIEVTWKRARSAYNYYGKIKLRANGNACACSCVLRYVRLRGLRYLPVRLSPRCCGHRKEGLGCCLLRMSPVRCDGCGPLAFQTIGDHYLPEREKVRMVTKIRWSTKLRLTRAQIREKNFPPSLAVFFRTMGETAESRPRAATTNSRPFSYPPVTSHPNRPYIFPPYALESGRLCFRYL